MTEPHVPFGTQPDPRQEHAATAPGSFHDQNGGRFKGKNVMTDAQETAYLAQPDPRQKPTVLNFTFQPQFVIGEGPHDLVFIDVHDAEGKSIKVGTWAADGEYEQLTITAEDFAPRDPLRDVHQAVISTPLPPDPEALRRLYAKTPHQAPMIASDAPRAQKLMMSSGYGQIGNKALATFWVAVSPQGEADIDRLCAVKRDCVITAGEVKAGWRVADVDLVETHAAMPLPDALHDFITHRSNWRTALLLAGLNAEQGDKGYWQHELRAFDHAMLMFDLRMAADRNGTPTRVQELLEANNALLERARAAEAPFDAESLAYRLSAHADLQEAWGKWELGDEPVPEPLFHKDTAALLREAASHLPNSTK